jgi:hypothetical protein
MSASKVCEGILDLLPRGGERILPARGGLGKQFGESGRRCDPVVGMVAPW